MCFVIRIVPTNTKQEKKRAEYLTRYCFYCGSEFEIPLERTEKGRGKYCSRDCFYKDLEDKSMLVEIDCAYCGDRLSVYPRDIEKGKKYCSKECFNKTLPGMESPMKGKKHTKETREKISMILTGRKLSDDVKRKLSERMSGEGNHFWEGGKTPEIYPKDWNKILKENIRQRDEYICQECGIHQDELEWKLDVHHIDYDKYNLDPENLISLCKSCHSKTNYNREHWLNCFNKELLWHTE